MNMSAHTHKHARIYNSKSEVLPVFLLTTQFSGMVCLSTCEIKSRIAMAKAEFNKKKNLFTSKLDLMNECVFQTCK
jgi:hypothetical protein